MRAFVARHLDRMAHLDHVDLVRFQRLLGENIKPARRCGGSAMSHPAGHATRNKRAKNRGRRDRAPRACAAREPVQFKPCRDRLRGQRAIACTNGLGLRLPAAYQSRVLGMRCQPGFDRSHAIRRQLAIDVLGRAYGLPEPIGTTNSEWFRGYPTPPPTTLIVIGLTRKQADSIFTGCRWAGHNGNSEGVKNEESVDHPDIFVCGPPRFPVQELWKEHQDFG